MKRSKTILIVLGIAAVGTVALVLSGTLTFKASITRNGGKTETEEPRAIKDAEFHSRYGYTITYPENWITDDSQKTAPVEFIREPNNKAFVGIQVGGDERLKNPGTKSQALEEAEDAFKKDKTYTLNFFEWQPRNAEVGSDSYMAAGSYTENGSDWRFREIAVFNQSGAVIFLRGNVRAESAGVYGPIVDKIIFSFLPAEITAESARAKIESLPEVLEYKKTLAASGKQATIEVEDGDNEWNVHVFEIVKEDGGTSHTATFGWYAVNKKTGKITNGL